jgi:multidrug efflux pump subunit AcrB
VLPLDGIWVAPVLALAVIATGILKHSLHAALIAAIVCAVSYVVVVALMYILENGYVWRFHEKFDEHFEKLRTFYGSLLAWSLESRGLVLAIFIGIVLSGIALPAFGLIGQGLLPDGRRGPDPAARAGAPGTRLEETERIYGKVENAIKADIPAAEIDTMLDNIGIPNSGINLSLSDGSLMSSADGEILIALKPRPPPDRGLPG